MPVVARVAGRVGSGWAGRRAAAAVVGLLTALCLALPTHNSTVDAWAYAAQVRYGHELLLPHHLWHNGLGWAWLQCLHLLGLRPDALAALKVLNALAYGAVLAVLGRLLRRLGGPALPVAAWLLAVGSCWGLLRFATENETYILPLLASLLASAAWLRAETAAGFAQAAPPAAGAPPTLGALPTAAAPPGRARATTAIRSFIPSLTHSLYLLAGAWAALAGLLHQGQIWWWLGLLAGTFWGAQRRWRPGAAAWFALPAALAWPLAYAAALPAWGLPLTPTALLHFVLHDFYVGTAGQQPVAHGLLLTAVGLLRTLAQLHGYLLPLLRQWPALALVPLAGSGLLIYALRRILNVRRATGSAGGPAEGWPGQAPPRRRVAAVHGLIFGLQFLFAALADGNAEFMVMLPVLAALVLATNGWARAMPGAAVAALGGTLLLWNVAFGLLPLRLLALQNLAPLHRLLARQPRARLLLADPNLLLNQHFYRTGNPTPPPQVLPGAARLLRRGPAPARAFLDSVRRAGHPLYTDLNNPAGPLDRAQLAYGTGNKALLHGLTVLPFDSARTFGGWYRVGVFNYEL